MPLAAGSSLGPYQILAPIGAGGMGEVYRAHDPRLGRDVAIKVAQERFSDRFEREARAVAALNHPNICHLYDVGENYLVMELVEGEDLKGPLPLKTALDYARQIAEALEAAHEKGIVHRDLKPANIKVNPQGVLKVLDFGLAQLSRDRPGAETDPEHSPTFTIPATAAGMILGTAAYMSPEQARGKAVDKRTDVWAFGCVLYEMLTGDRPFQGDTVTDLMAAVVREEPAWDRVPLPAQRLLRRCLEKDPQRRLRDIGDAMFLLDHSAPVTHPRPSESRWAVTVAVIIFATAVGLTYFRPAASEARVLKFAVPPPEKAVFRPSSPPAISPDGHSLAFVAALDGKDQLWVRDLDSLMNRPLPGTEGADDPFWSPDSRSLAFFAQGKLKRIDAAMPGPVMQLCDSQENFGGSWGKGDVILFAPFSGGLVRIPAAGGAPIPVTTLDRTLSENSHRSPSFLPDGRHFLYTAANTVDPSNNGVYLDDLESAHDSKTRRKILPANSNAVYAAPGYLLFIRDRTLMAQPFDAGSAQTNGDPIAIAQQVDYNGAFSLGNFSASQNGVVVFTSGGSGGSQQLTWFDRIGKVLGTVGMPGNLQHPAISPDDTTVAIDRFDPQTGFWDVWLHDLSRGTASRLTFDSKNNNMPIWSPDGSQVAFASTRDGGSNIYQKATNGAAPDELLDNAARTKLPLDWSRDGRYIIELVRDPKTKNDIWVLPLFGDRKPFPYLQGSFNEGDARLSPNGRWLAYASDETTRVEIYVQSFPMHTGKWQISNGGGQLPVWSRDGKELYFVGPDEKLMAIEVNGDALKGGSEFKAGVPRPLFQKPPASGVAQFYVVSKDGRFLIPVAIEQKAAVPMTVVVNWTAALKRN